MYVLNTAGCAVVPTRQEAAVTQEGEGSEVFISIQAFPALLDLPEESEMKKMSCGTRHTAAVTCKYCTSGYSDSTQTALCADNPLFTELPGSCLAWLGVLLPLLRCTQLKRFLLFYQHPICH